MCDFDGDSSPEFAGGLASLRLAGARLLARFVESPLSLKGHHGDGLVLNFRENLSGRFGSTGAPEEQLPDKAHELAHSLSFLRLIG